MLTDLVLNIDILDIDFDSLLMLDVFLVFELMLSLLFVCVPFRLVDASEYEKYKDNYYWKENLFLCEEIGFS